MPAEANDDAAEAAERERERIELLKQRCVDELARLRELAPAGEAKQVGDGVKGLLTALNDPKLAVDFANAVRGELKSLELMATMKAADMAVRRALEHAQADRKLERNQDVGLARLYLSKAVGLGASDEFKRIAEMSIESAMLTGGVKQMGPTRAKPVETAPAAFSLAKGDRREFKRYDTPPLTVTVGDKKFSTTDWAMGGMLVAGSTADEFPSSEPAQVSLSAPGQRGTSATVVSVRVEIRRGGMGVKFLQITPELGNFLKAVIMSRSKG